MNRRMQMMFIRLSMYERALTCPATYPSQQKDLQCKHRILYEHKAGCNK